ncbi:MAG: hypothetical protein LUG64_03715 [Clostridiales bacterium]|nr:hypothetical protein [Clostridiales bacterium]
MTSTRSSRDERKNGAFRRVFWWQMKNNRTFSVFFALWVIVSMPMFTLGTILGNQTYYTDMSNWEGYTAEAVAQFYGQAVYYSLLAFLRIGIFLVLMLYLVVYCCNSFGYMHTRRSVDLFHALPIRRRPLLLGGYVAGLVTSILPLAIGFGLCQAVCAAYSIQLPDPLRSLWAIFGCFALMTFACLTFMLFFMVTSGTLLDAAVSLTATAAGWPLLWVVLNATMKQFLPGYVSVIPSAFYTALCPFGAFYQLFSTNYTIPTGAYYTDGSPITVDLPGLGLVSILWWALFTVALLLVTVWYYGRRKSEHAENSFCAPVLRGAVRFLLSVAVGLGLADILGEMTDSNQVYFISVLVGSLGAYIVIQVVWARGFRRFWRAVPAYLLTLAACVGFLYTLYTGGLGYVTRTPNMDNVTSVSFYLPGLAGDDSKECYLASHGVGALDVSYGSYSWGYFQVEFTDADEQNTVLALHQEILKKYPGPYLPFGDGTNQYSLTTISVTYTLANGSTLERAYYVPLYEDDEAIFSAIAAVQKCDTFQLYDTFYSMTDEDINGLYVSQYTSEYDYDASNYELTDEQKEQVWSTFLEELDSADFSYAEGHDDYIIQSASEYADDYAELQSLAGEKTYSITMNDLKYADLNAEQQALLVQLLGQTDAVTATVCSYGFNVPECCEKTRALLDELTEANGDYYYYDDEEDYAAAAAVESDVAAEGETDPADSGAADASTDPADGSVPVEEGDAVVTTIDPADVSAVG